MTEFSDAADARFPRRARLTKPSEFRRVFSGAKRLGDGFFTVLAVPNELGYPRLGLAIAKRAIPRAVGRNRIKRLIRESFRTEQACLGSWDVVVLGKPGVRRADAARLRQALARHWRRLQQ